MSADDPVITATSLGKMYPLYARPADRLKQAFLWGRRQLFREFWALRDVSFEIGRSEVIGVIGRNGSGKSTLLQILAGVLRPSTGEVAVRGRVAALLELGSGFNPDFTGRENVYMNGSILGLTRRQIDQQFDRIVAFSEIARFIDQPVKIYSSGMVMRLAFAISVHVDADVLAVDEALAVGDEAFQRKCYSRLRSLKDSGTTILFVSHSATAVVEFCTRAILLEAGELLMHGEPRRVVNQYHRLLFAPADRLEQLRAEIRAGATASASGPVAMGAPRGEDGGERAAPPPVSPSPSAPAAALLEQDAGAREPAPGQMDFFAPEMRPSSTTVYVSRGARIENPQVLNERGERVNVLVSGRKYRYCFTARFDEPAWNVRFAMLIKTKTGLELGGAVTHPPNRAIPAMEADSVIEVEFAFTCRLTAGAYFLNAGIMATREGTECYLHRIVDAAMFKVQPVADALATSYIDFDARPRVTRATAAQPQRVG